MIVRLLGLLLVLAWLPAARAAGAEAFAFALIGDTPYTRFERTLFPDFLEQVGNDEVAFLIHVGDIKSGSEPCDDALYLDRKALFEASQVPFVLVPGDNDWSDCARLSAGRHDPLERLALLRRVFYAQPASLGRRRLAVESQAERPGAPHFPENLFWQFHGVSFVTLNVIGPNNLRGRSPRPPEEFSQRSAANLAWLDAAFERARQDRSVALVVAIQADPHFERFVAGDPKPGYAEFLERLRNRTLGFDGEVLLLHGDGHEHQIDQPLRDADGRRIANFTRIESYGSPLMGWVRIAVRPRSKPLFAFHSRGYSPSADRLIVR